MNIRTCLLVSRKAAPKKICFPHTKTKLRSGPVPLFSPHETTIQNHLHSKQNIPRIYSFSLIIVAGVCLTWFKRVFLCVRLWSRHVSSAESILVKKKGKGVDRLLFMHTRLHLGCQNCKIIIIVLF